MSFWLPRLALASLWNRRLSALLTILSILIAVMLFLGIDKLREGARDGFSNAMRGSHLIVGARTSEINLLLYAVFRMGDATAEIRWETFETLNAREDVAWTIPISLGDSYRGYRVMGTNADYFEHYQYGRGDSLEFSQGTVFTPIFGAVFGAEAAAKLDVNIGDRITLAHGLKSLPGAADHADRPFVITGILAPTGTPVDRTVHVPLEGITAIHVGWETGTRNPLVGTLSTEQIKAFNLTPKTITAVFVGLKNNGRSILRTQRALNTYRGEPLSAIIPSQALESLWTLTGVAEQALLAVAICVIFASLISIAVSLLSSLNQRRREIAILRAVGLGPPAITGLLVGEAGLLGFIGAGIGIILTNLAALILAPIAQSQFGLTLNGFALGLTDFYIMATIVGGALLIGLIPGFMAYRFAVNDGISSGA